MDTHKSGFIATRSRSAGRRVPTLVTILLIADLCFVALFLLSRFSGSTVQRLFDLDEESSFPTWYSAIKLFLLGVLTGMHALSRFDRAVRCSWVLLVFPILFFLMSADEIAMIHEGINRALDAFLPAGSREGTLFHETGLWTLVIGIPFLAVFLVCLWIARKCFSDVRGSLGKIGAGMGVFLAGAIGLEILANFPVLGGSSYLHVLAAEGLEMLGATLMIWGGAELGRDPQALSAASTLMGSDVQE